VPAHRHFLGRGFGVKIHEDDRRIAPCGSDFVGMTRNGSSIAVMKTRPMPLTTAIGTPLVRARKVRPRPGVPAACSPAQQPGMVGEVGDDLLLVPRVIAARHDLHAVLQEIVGQIRCDAESRRGILDVAMTRSIP
jgi:hypothetical protein